MTDDEFDSGLKEVKTASEELLTPRRVSEVGIWQYIVDEDGDNRTVWDESIERLYGLEPGSFEGTHEAWMEHVHPDDIEKTDEEWWRAIEENRPFQMVYRIIRPDGEVRWVDSRALMLTDDEGNFVRGVGMETDITQRIQQFQQLQITDRVMRHDFRTGLNIMRGYAQEIVDNAKGSNKEHAQQILEESNQLLRGIDKHREISKTLAAEAGPASNDLRSLVNESIEAVEQDYPKVAIQLTASDDVLNATVSVVESFGSALEEAIRNAIEHHDSDDPAVELTVAIEDDTVVIQVCDDGPGIPLEELEVVLGRQTVDSLHHLSGLGLWLIAWAVTRSGGQLDITDNEPRGSIVQMELPVSATP